MFSIDTKNSSESGRNLTNEEQVNPLVPGNLVRRRKNTENTFVLILATDNRAVDMGATFTHIAG